MENLKIKKIVLGISALPVSLGCMAINQTEVTEQRNILVIVCDQLRPDFLNVYGGKMIECEGTNELARMGVVFDNAITASPVSGKGFDDDRAISEYSWRLVQRPAFQ